MMARDSSIGWSENRPVGIMPALLIHSSIGPSVDSTCAIISAISVTAGNEVFGECATDVPDATGALLPLYALSSI